MPHATARVTRALFVATAMVASLLLWASPAGAEDLSGGRLDWGVKESFRNYITGPIAQGSVQTGDGASTANGAYRFHSASGSYDGGTATIDYRGWVYFWGHDGELDVTFANPSVEYSGSSGTLYVYVNGSRTDMASLSGASLSASGGTVSVSGASATLTANGATAFAGYYEAGQALNPVSFSADVVASQPEPEQTTEAATEAPEAEDDTVGGAILDWGVRTSWREYVSGNIAEGSWTVADGAADGGAVFRFPEGAGTATTTDYELSYKGTVAFTGTNVDLAITDPAVTATGGAGVLSAEIDGERIDLVSFEAELTEADDLLLAEAVPTTLTEAAVPVFGGYYQAGDPMDPLTIAVPLTEDAALPVLPDLGSDPDEPTPAASTEPAPAAAADEDGANPLIWIVPAALVLVMGAAAAVIALKRRKRTDPDADEASEPAASAPTSEPTPSETATPAENGQDGPTAPPAESSPEDTEADKEK